MNVFKSNSRIIKDKNIIKNRLLLVVISEWFVCKLIDFFTIRVEYYNFLNLHGRYVPLYESFLTMYETDKSKISRITVEYFST